MLDVLDCREDDDDCCELSELDGIELDDIELDIDDSHCSQSYSMTQASAEPHRWSVSVSWKRIRSSMAFRIIHSPEA